jgi:hypothetical protein
MRAAFVAVAVAAALALPTVAHGVSISPPVPNPQAFHRVRGSVEVVRPAHAAARARELRREVVRLAGHAAHGR